LKYGIIIKINKKIKKKKVDARLHRAEVAPSPEVGLPSPPSVSTFAEGGVGDGNLPGGEAPGGYSTPS